MTVEELVGYSVEQLEALSDEELTKQLSHYFSVTRPAPFSQRTKAKHDLDAVTKTTRAANVDGRKLFETIKEAKSHGIDLSKLTGLLANKRKRK